VQAAKHFFFLFVGDHKRFKTFASGVVVSSKIYTVRSGESIKQNKMMYVVEVLALERIEEYGVLHFNDEFSSLGHELRLCLKDEERILLEQEKNIIKEQRFRVEEAKRMRLKEDKLLQIAKLKKAA
nr:hypothetical protein [Tanacetum cinerariifolium]